MTDVFLSYRNLPAQRALVERLAAILEAHGFDVWWDYGLEAGAPYREQILAQLSAAKVVVPLWCTESVQSEWVRMEAELGKDKLVPARLQRVPPPDAFEAIQAADLIGWDGRVDHDPLERFIARVAERAGVSVKKRVSLIGTLRHLPALATLTTDNTGALSPAVARLRARLGDAPRLNDLHHYAESFAGEDAFEARRMIEQVKAFEAARDAEARGPLRDFLHRYPSARQATEARFLLARLPLAVNWAATLDCQEGLVGSARFSPDGTRIVTASTDNTVRVWDVASQRETALLRGHEDWVLCASFSPDGTRIVSAGHDMTARVWDASSGRELIVLRGHENILLSASFSVDGARIITASIDDSVRVWDVSSGSAIVVMREGSLLHAAFNADGTRIVTAGKDKIARVRDAASGREIAVMSGHEDQVNVAAFSSNGALIVTASNDRTARVWDSASGREMTVLSGHEGWVYAASFSPDGTRIVTADDEAVHVWDVASGNEIATLRGYEVDIVRDAAFSPDGKRIVTTFDQTARIWEIEEDA